MIRACIFDLGGTLVDRYSLTPLLSLKETFSRKGIFVTNQSILKDMGKSKKDHIQHILKKEYVHDHWTFQYGKAPDTNDIDLLFNDFNEIQKKRCDDIMDVLPETEKTIQYLQNNKIFSGCTTGFDKGNMALIQRKLNYRGIHLDNYVSSSCLGKPSRPNPSMIFENIANFNINDTKQVIKIDDTNVGILEGKKANCWTVAVARWSVNMNIQSIDEAYSLSDYETSGKLIQCKKELMKSNPDFLISTLDELPHVIQTIHNYQE